VIFEVTWKLVLRGKKTQTRRPVQRAPRSEWIVRRDGSRRRRPPARVIQVDGQFYRACRYTVGHTYSVQPGYAKRGDARIIVTAVERQRLGDITFAEARAEGFRTTDEFKQAWVRIHDREWLERELVDRAEIFGDDAVPFILRARFEQRHADRLVWAITFELDRESPRLLAPATDDEDYTSQSARALTEPTMGIDGDGHRRPVPEPEPVDDATLERFAVDAAARRAGEPGRREEALRQRARSLARRLRQEADIGARSGEDVIAELVQIEEQIRLLERGRDEAA
jgi:hypothetical protein